MPCRKESVFGFDLFVDLFTVGDPSRVKTCDF